MCNAILTNPNTPIYLLNILRRRQPLLVFILSRNHGPLCSNHVSLEIYRPQLLLLHPILLDTYRLQQSRLDHLFRRTPPLQKLLLKLMSTRPYQLLPMPHHLLPRRYPRLQLLRLHLLFLNFNHLSRPQITPVLYRQVMILNPQFVT